MEKKIKEKYRDSVFSNAEILINKLLVEQICKVKPRVLTKEEIKANKLAVLKEKKRRAKKITMTVGELEDKLDAVSYSDY